MTSEDKHDIAPQPPATCPTINYAIKLVNRAESVMRGYEKMDVERSA